MSAGWFILHRGWMASADFQPEPFTEREAFLWSIEQAAHSAHEQWFNGVLIAVARGEFATSTRKMAAAFQWGEKRARLFAARMEKRGKWTLRAAHQGAHVATILSVCNYERFQDVGKAKGTPSDTAKGAPGAHLGHTEGAQQKQGKTHGKELERKECAASPAARAPNLPYQEALDAWEAVAAQHPQWKPRKPSLDDKRRAALAKILKAHGLDGWKAALARAHSSKLLGGPDPPGWFNLAFMLRPDKFLNTLEGNYDECFDDNRPQGRSSNWGGAYARSHEMPV